MTKLKIIHTGDWHLGKSLFEKDRSDEHQLFLDWLLNIIKIQNIDAIIIAGDIFDVPYPSHTSQTLYFNFLAKLKELKVYTYVLSGNHDSNRGLEMPCHLIETPYLKINSGVDIGKSQLPMIIKKDGQKLEIYGLPYSRPHFWSKWAKENNIEQCDSETPLTIHWIKNWLKGLQKGSGTQILTAHHGIGPYTAAGTEHTLFLEGNSSIPTSIFGTRFDYIALGHIHKRQIIQKSPPMVYAGAPLAFRHGENFKKSIEIVEVDIKNKTIDHSPLNIPSFREIITIKGSYKSIIAQSEDIKVDDKSLLRPFVIIQIDETKNNEELLAEIKSIIKKKECELIRVVRTYQVYDDSSIDLNIEVENLSVQDLFSKYLSSLELTKGHTSDLNNGLKTLNQLWEGHED